MCKNEQTVNFYHIATPSKSHRIQHTVYSWYWKSVFHVYIYIIPKNFLHVDVHHPPEQCACLYVCAWERVPLPIYASVLVPFSYYRATIISLFTCSSHSLSPSLARALYIPLWRKQASYNIYTYFFSFFFFRVKVKIHLCKRENMADNLAWMFLNWTIWYILPYQCAEFNCECEIYRIEIRIESNRF